MAGTPLKVERPALPRAPRTSVEWMLTGKNPERRKQRASALWGRANRFRNEAFFAKTSDALVNAAVRFLLGVRDLKPNPMTAIVAMQYTSQIVGPLFGRVYHRLAEVCPGDGSTAVAPSSEALSYGVKCDACGQWVTKCSCPAVA